MKHEEFRLDEAIAILERTPSGLSALLDGLPETWVKATEGEGRWSPYDVIGHLIHGERTDWIPRTLHILAGEQRPFDPFDQQGHVAVTRGKALKDLLGTFEELRRSNIAKLRGMNLSVNDLDREGLHPELGRVTLSELLATWVVHDLDHVAQISRTMAKVYTEATGPWIKYLSILRDRQ